MRVVANDYILYIVVIVKLCIIIRCTIIQCIRDTKIIPDEKICIRC